MLVQAYTIPTIRVCSSKLSLQDQVTTDCIN